MSIVEVKCPSCGSPCNKNRGKQNEYVCSHCGTVFHFVDKSQRTITKEVRVRNCIFCGKPIERGKGFKCTRCNREYFCENCVDSISHKFVCADCIVESDQKCGYCIKYAIYSCVQCGRKACKNHGVDARFFLIYSGGVKGKVFYCSQCRKFVCQDCVKRGFLSSTPRCPKCNSALGEYAPYE